MTWTLTGSVYVSLLEKLIGEVEFLQDNPPKFVPQEDIGSYTVIASVIIKLIFMQALLVLAVSGSHTGYMQCKSHRYIRIHSCSLGK